MYTRGTAGVCIIGVKVKEKESVVMCKNQYLFIEFTLLYTPTTD